MMQIGLIFISHFFFIGFAVCKDIPVVRNVYAVLSDVKIYVSNSGSIQQSLSLSFSNEVFSHRARMLPLDTLLDGNSEAKRASKEASLRADTLSATKKKLDILTQDDLDEKISQFEESISGKSTEEVLTGLRKRKFFSDSALKILEDRIDTLSTSTALTDSLEVPSLLQGEDSTLRDTSKYDTSGQSLPKNDLDQKIDFKAEKRLHYDNKTRLMVLEEKVIVSYKDTKIEAHEVLMEPSHNFIKAQSLKDSSGNLITPITIHQGKNQYDAGKASYNIRTSQGRITEVNTKVRAIKNKQKKFVAEKAKIYKSKEVNVEGGYYTSCDLDYPHYYFYGEQMRIDPNNELVSRPVTLYIEDVPILPLPFFYYPITSRRRSGIIFPQYGVDPVRGLYLTGLGYFWAINDYMDLKIIGSIGTRGNWSVRPEYRLQVGRRLSITANGEFSRSVANETTDPDYRQEDRWSAQLEYVQIIDPVTTLTTSLNLGGGSTFSPFTSNPIKRVESDRKSSLNFKHNFSETASFTLGATRVQGLESLNGSNNFSLSFSAPGSFYPFKPRVGSSGILDKLRLSVNPPSLNAGLSHTDTTLSWNGRFSTGYTASFLPIKGSNFNISQSFSGISLTYSESYEKSALLTSRYGGTFPFSLNVTGDLFRYVKLSGRFTLNTFLVDKTVRRYYNVDTRQTVSEIIDGAEFFQTYDLNARVSTKLYGILYTPVLNFMGLKAVRHVLSPSLSYTYRPDFTDDYYGYYQSYERNGKIERYNRFADNQYGSVPRENQKLDINLNNSFEIKTIIPDSTKPENVSERQLTLLSANLRTGYDFARDSLNLSDISISGNTFSLQNLGPMSSLTLGYRLVLDPYSYNDKGNRIREFLLSHRGHLVRLKSATLNMTVRFSGSTLGSKSKRKDLDETDATLSDLQSLDYSGVNLSKRWSLNITGRLTVNEKTPLEPHDITGDIRVGGSIQLTKGWRIGGELRYNFATEKFNYPQISLTRDFHCWDMKLRWTPVGVHQGIEFSVGFTADELKSIKYVRKGSSTDFDPKSVLDDVRSF